MASNEMVEPLQKDSLPNGKMTDDKFGFSATAPGADWVWYQSKTPVGDKDYLLMHEDGEKFILIQILRDHSNDIGLSPKRMKNIARGMELEARDRGVVYNNFSYEASNLPQSSSYRYSFDYELADNRVVKVRGYIALRKHLFYISLNTVESLPSEAGLKSLIHSFVWLQNQ